MRKAKFKVVAMWDSEAEVWYVSETDVPGLNAEGETLDELLAELRILVPELLLLNGVITAQDKNGIEVPWDLVSLHRRSQGKAHHLVQPNIRKTLFCTA